MVRKRESKQYEQYSRLLVLCEGSTEVWYLEQQLDTIKYKVKAVKNSYSNALKLVKLAINCYISKWDKIYCVFDRDSKSNTKEQLREANRLINKNQGVLIRIISNPCFEIIWLFNFEKIIREFSNYDEIEGMLNKNLKLSGGKKYEKNQDCINQICELTDFGRVCYTAKVIYEELAVNHNNWLTVTEGFSEIFKLNSN
ncbi:MAG: hypothetical protein QG673_2106 [Pseudomonadota bacterium]|nr:hypothetical protein [Pseudomonadota bacterium]